MKNATGSSVVLSQRDSPFWRSLFISLDFVVLLALSGCSTSGGTTDMAAAKATPISTAPKIDPR